MKGEFGTLRDVTSDAFKKEAKVLDPNETRRERLWKDCVNQAKALVRINDETRWKIVELAKKCCTIHWGGRATNERFTVKNFAVEIGINPKTLQEWIRLRKIADSVKEEPGSEKLSMNQIRYIDRGLVGIKRNDKDFSKKAAELYKKTSKRSASTIKMTKYMKHLKSVLFNVKNKAMIKGCEEEVLIEILHTCREIVFELRNIDVQTKVRKK